MSVQITHNGKMLARLMEQLENAQRKAVYMGVPGETNKAVEDQPQFNLATLATVL